MKYRFIRDYSSVFRVQKMCQVLTVSRSGYYAWLNRPESELDKSNRRLLKQIRRMHKASRFTYGSPRVTRDLKDDGIRCSENRVARLMRLHDIRSKTKRKFKATTDSKHQLPVADNLVRQNFNASKPDELWTSDITYVWTREGWLYLAVILDVCTRAIVGWATNPRMTQELVLSALRQALRQRKTKPGLIFHSDRGSQYASQTVKELIKNTTSFKV